MGIPEEEHIANLIYEYHCRKISNNGLGKLKAWLQEDPENPDEFAKYLSLLKECDIVAGLHPIRMEKAWKNIHRAISKPKQATKKKPLKYWLPYVAAVAIVFVVSHVMVKQVKTDFDLNRKDDFTKISSIGSSKAVLTLCSGTKINLEENSDSLFLETDGTVIRKNSESEIEYVARKSNPSKNIYNCIEIPRGGEYALSLADGSKVWLNSESVLKYPVQFTGKVRKVELTGEAYFEVAHHKEKAFVIQSRDLQIKVLGTSFNLSSYENDEYIETTLVEGKIEVHCLGNTALLQPGNQALLKRGENKFQISKVNPQLYTSWKDGVFRFKNQSLERICCQLSRWYNVEFFFTHVQHKQLRFTGAVKKDKPLVFALDLIQKMAEVRFAVKDDKVIVTK